MTNLRKILAFVTVMMVAAFALPSMAASSSSKYFYVVFPTTIPNTGPSGNENIQMGVFNATPPPGVSTINSMEIIAPAGVVINSVSGGTLAASPCSDCILNNIPGIKSGQSATFTLNVTVNASACVSENWQAFANNGNAYPKGDFFIDQHPAAENLVSGVGCNGLLGCASTNNKGGNLDPTQDSFVGTPDWGLVRGPNWDDLTGANCVLVPYQFNFDPTNNTASFLPNKGGQKIVVEYVLLWNPVAPDANGWTSKQPLVSWGVANPAYPGDYIPALACVVDEFNIGKLALPIIPNVPPYAGNSHSQYLPGQQALVCVAQQGWTAVTDPPDPNNILIQYWDKIIDEVDTYVKMP